MLNILLKLEEPLGIDLGPNFDLVANVGLVTPSTVTRAELLTGINVSVTQTATEITIYSEGTCTNGITINIANLPAPIDFAISTICDADPSRGRMNILANNVTGGYGGAYFFTAQYFFNQSDAEASNNYIGPGTGVQYGTNIYFDCPVTAWVGIIDTYGNKTVKSLTNDCYPYTTTTTQYVPFPTTSTTTTNPNDTHKSYIVNKYICDQNCTPTLFNQIITVPIASIVEIGKYYLSSSPNISLLILEQTVWNGTPGNDITNFVAYDYCYQACGYTPTTTSTTTILSAPINTVFVNYDVVPGPAQDVNTVFVKYDIQ